VSSIVARPQQRNQRNVAGVTVTQAVISINSRFLARHSLDPSGLG
jgi:hypothetical protein